MPTDLLRVDEEMPGAVPGTESRGNRPGWAVGWALDWLDEREPVAAGRALLVVCGLFVSATAPLLGPDRTGWLALLVVSATMTVATLGSLFVPWSRLSRRWSLAFPVLVLSALAVLGSWGGGLAAPYGALFVLCFAYTGLTQPPGPNLALVPPGALAFGVAMNGWTAVGGIRLVVVSAVCLLLSQVLAELTARQQTLTDHLRAAAHTDPLTGLGNRRSLQVRLEALRRGDVLVVCDLDHFKRLNDAQGHAAGDRVLAEFGLLLRACLREEDYAARYGGEEFVLVLGGRTTAQAQAALTRLREQWALLRPDVTFSAGVAACGRDGQGAVLLADADRALYEAKAGGRDCDRVAEDRRVPG